MDQGVPNLNEIDTQTGFAHFDAGLTEKDHEALTQIVIKTTGAYDNFGALDKAQIEKDAADLFEQLGNSRDAAKELAEIAARMVERAVLGFGSETAWVTIRAFLPTDEYDVPRPHTDGNFYGAEGDQLKAVYSLTGASTLLYRADEEQREQIMKLQLAEDMPEMESRKRRQAVLESAKTETTPSGCGTVFVIGSDHPTVHSEPPIKKPRIFLSVLPGTREQIEKLRQDWGRAKKIEVRLGGQKPAQVIKPPRLKQTINARY